MVYHLKGRTDAKELSNPFGIPDKPAVSSLLYTGNFTLLVLMGGFFIWALLSPLSSAAMAPGIVQVESERKTLQHLEGGIITELAVREGDHVEAGQILIRLDDLQAKAVHDLMEAQMVELSAQRARLLAERDELSAIAFPDFIASRLAELPISDVVNGQERIFASGRKALHGRIDVMQQRIAQLDAQISAFNAQLGAGMEQSALIAEEMASVRTLLQSGLERKPRLLALERDAARLNGQQGEYSGRIAQAQEAISSIRLEVLNAREARVEKAVLELHEVETQLVQVNERLAQANVILKRRNILAPESGTIFNLKYHTVGGVIPPGKEILDIVPEGDNFVIEARINPTDIDVVHEGMTAKLYLSAFKSRTTPHIDGQVIRVSADAIREERTGKTHYLAKIKIFRHNSLETDSIRLFPGMPVETVIITGNGTFAEYFIQPLTDSFRRSFREQ